MTPEQVKTVAERRFGRRWRPLLAEHLGVHLSLIYRWFLEPGHRDFRPIQPWVGKVLEADEKVRAVEQTKKKLMKMIGGGK